MITYVRQRTLSRPVQCTGRGVHSGKSVTMILRPAPVNHGIKFRRLDLPDQPCVTAHFNMVVDTSLATVIGYDGFIVSTIEHLMAALAGLSIDNVLVELDSYEIPIMDGSAGPFTTLIQTVGIRQQEAPRYFIVIKEPIELKENGKAVSIFPASSFRISYVIEYDHPFIRRQSLSLHVSDDVFVREIAKARTFGFLRELEYLKAYGFAKGGSLDNALVIDDKGILNGEGLRFRDEFVRHKILDCIGDLSLLGMPLIGHVVVHKSGHAFNHAFIQKFFSQKDVWETRTLLDADRKIFARRSPVPV